MTLIQDHELALRLMSFGGVLVIMALVEVLIPKKTRTMPRTSRWTTNLLLVVVDSLVLRITMPILAVALASWSEVNNIGVLNWLSLPSFIEIIAAVILLDMAIYFQHVMSHKMPMLWMFHKVHHADRDIDVTTGLRFHPIEIVFSMFYKLVWILLLGPSASAVILFEIILNGSAMFNHSNISLSKKLDNRLRKIIVTPDSHRVHHSVIQQETDSNYGFFLSIWDKLFGTYNPQPKDTHDGMIIGLDEYQTAAPSTLKWCLTVPWQKTDKHNEKGIRENHE